MRPFLLSPFLLLLVPSIARAQCEFADVQAYQGTTPNPITLTTVYPLDYPGIGSSIHLNSPDAPPSQLKILFAAPSAGILPAGPPLLGTLLLTGAFPVSPLQTQADWTFLVPDFTPPGVPWFFQCLSTDGVEFLLSNGLELTPDDGAEIEVLSVTSIGEDPLEGSTNHGYEVTFRNNGVSPATPVIKVCVGGNCGSAPFTVNPGQTLTETVFVDTPSIAPLLCGGESMGLTACSLLANPDCNQENDCVASSVFVKDKHWNLQLEIINEPSSVHVGSTAFWKVRVSNKGTVPSDNVCFVNAIVLHSGSGFGAFAPAICNNVQKVWTGSIAPGASKTFSLSQDIWCGAALGTQWIKTEISSYWGCFDNCTAGNFDQESIQILF